MNRLIIFLLFIAFVSCEKDESPHFSEKYLGQYMCVKRFSEFVIAPPNSMEPENIVTYDTIVIAVERSGISNDVLLLDGIEVTVSEDGALNSYHEEPINCGRGEGYFAADSVYFLQSDMFCEDYTWYKGIKISED